MKSAAVIIIGNEILSGRTRDANMPFLGKRLAELGINLLEATVIPDDEQTIINTVNRYRNNFTYVFTTGGIGPTHDDITSASVAKAFNVLLEIHPEALGYLENYYDPGTINDARLKMAYVPVGAILIRNPVSAAPGFQIENVFVLPGVPEIMQAMFDGMTDRLTGGPPLLTRTISTNLRESTLAAGLGIIQEQHQDVAIGSYPYFKMSKLGVNLVMRSINPANLDIVFEQIKNLIVELGGVILDSE